MPWYTSRLQVIQAVTPLIAIFVTLGGVQLLKNIPPLIIESALLFLGLAAGFWIRAVTRGHPKSIAGQNSADQAKSFPLALLRLEEVDAVVGHPKHRLQSAKHEVWISGNDCKYIVESMSTEIRSILQRGIKVRILCVDPESAAAPMLQKIDPRFPRPESFKNSMQSVFDELTDLSSVGGSLEVRLIPILPAFGFFLIDPTRPAGKVKVEIYASRPFNPYSSRPHLVIDSQLFDWQQYFIHQFQNYWEMARPFTPLTRQLIS